MKKKYVVVWRYRGRPRMTSEWAWVVYCDNIYFLEEAQKTAKDLVLKHPNEEIQIWQDITETKVIKKIQ